MKITSSEPKNYLGRSGKGLITSLGIKINVSSKKYKKENYAITNVSMNNPSKVIKKFENLSYKGYVRKRPKHEPTASYCYQSIHIDKFMMRADALNLQIDPVRTGMTGMQQIPILNVF